MVVVPGDDSSGCISRDGLFGELNFLEPNHARGYAIARSDDTRDAIFERRREESPDECQNTTNGAGRTRFENANEIDGTRRDETTANILRAFRIERKTIPRRDDRNAPSSPDSSFDELPKGTPNVRSETREPRARMRTVETENRSSLRSRSEDDDEKNPIARLKSREKKEDERTGIRVRDENEKERNDGGSRKRGARTGSARRERRGGPRRRRSQTEKENGLSDEDRRGRRPLEKAAGLWKYPETVLFPVFVEATKKLDGKLEEKYTGTI